MVSRVQVWCVGIVLVLGSVGASSASAQFFGGPGGYGVGFFNYGDWNRPHIPYYALYPPVYYSYPVPRTYGYSPFAYPPGVFTPEVSFEPGTVTRDNPHVPQRTQPKPERNTVTDKSRTYQNPFVISQVASSEAAGSEAAGSEAASEPLAAKPN